MRLNSFTVPRNARWLLLATLLPFAAVAASRWSEPPSAEEGDYAHYLLHAKALAEGRPYSDIGFISTSMNWTIGPEVQPPGWPLLLTPFVAVFGTDSPVFKGLVTLLVAAFTLIAGTYFIRRNELVGGIAAAVAVPISLETGYATSSALSDPLFCVLLWLTLLVADGEGTSGWARGVVLALLCVATISVRIAGVALPPALFLHAIVNRRNDRLKVVIPLGLVLVAGGFFAVFSIGEIPFLSRAFVHLPSPSELADTYRTAVSTAALYPFGTNLANDAYHAVVAIPLVVGAVVFLHRNLRSALTVFIVTYVFLLATAPVRDPRYAWPLYPLFMACVAIGLSWLGNRFLPLRIRPAVPGFALVLIAAVSISSAVRLTMMPERRSLVRDPDTVALFKWLRVTDDTTNLRVVFTNPRVLTLETDVPAMAIPFGEAKAVLAELDRKRITHVVLPRLHFTRRAEQRLVTIVSENPAHFPPVFENASHDVRRFVARPVPVADSGVAHVPRPQ